MRRPHLLSFALCSLVGTTALSAQARDSTPPTPRGEARQVLDTAFVPPSLGAPAFANRTGPLILIDEAHHNFHTASGRYRPFAKLLENDGFRVGANSQAITAAALKNARVLVIANALNAAHARQSDWKAPGKSAFTKSEIAAIAAWVNDGGSLLLIADHMPFAGDAAALAAALGFRTTNNYALKGEPDPRTGDYPITFRRADGTLKSSAITNGRGASERVDSIVSFTGSAFSFLSRRGSPLMSLPRGTRVRTPTVAWQFNDSTPTVDGAGLLQGATLSVGKGRVAMFGEAAMFTAQRKGVEGVPMGMNAPEASQNPQFVLNVMHWLVRILP